MPFNRSTALERLRRFDLIELFTQEVGWDRHKSSLNILLSTGEKFNLSAIAQKKGVVVYNLALPNGAKFPDYSSRREIEQKVAQATRENIIIYTDSNLSRQIWQWVKRGPDHPAAMREQHFHRSQSGEALLQKLEMLWISLHDEETLTLVDVTRRVQSGFDVEKVTKRFYEQFRREHGVFLKFISGIDVTQDREWYASLMMNRLMFVYFVQKKGFLDGNINYLRDRLLQMRNEFGRDKFYSFYRFFLLQLFHKGLGSKDRPVKLEKLLGRIPYLNGGLFERHAIEIRYPDIQIPDRAFEHVFSYFDEYQWHLDERPIRTGNEINPDVLGYIFEKYINQKQMGAYYTKEDITEYISRSTVIPRIFDLARDGGSTTPEQEYSIDAWDLLKRDPNRYIPKALRHGINWRFDAGDLDQGMAIERPIKIPADIANVIESPGSKGRLNEVAPPEIGLPTERWGEVIVRRERYRILYDRCISGEIAKIEDLITFNLDIRQFAQDSVESARGPDDLLRLWQAINRIAILDPTCGSGAFLFAALNVLAPLYEACLDRMGSFLSDIAAATGSAVNGETKPRSPHLSNGVLQQFAALLDRVAGHPSRRYFVLKSIILHNLYGVDLMDEAVEICKLRLFLKLAAQVTPDMSKGNLGIEPLPDIDFNIKAGNTLVGYATRRELEGIASGDWLLAEEVKEVIAAAEEARTLYERFQESQIEDQTVSSEFKGELTEKLLSAKDKADVFLAETYQQDLSKKPAAFEKWKRSHVPFHWFIEYYGIMNKGGFDVVIGNPPYVNAIKVLPDYSVKNYATIGCPDIYAWVLERTESLLRVGGRTGMIVPLSLGFSTDFGPIRELLFRQYGQNWFSSFGRIPAALFNFDVRIRNTIHIGYKTERRGRFYTSRLHRWFEAARPHLFSTLEYAGFKPELWRGRIPKLGSERLATAFEGLLQATNRTLAASTSQRPTKHRLYFKQTAYNWLNFCRKLPPCYIGDAPVEHTQFGSIFFRTEKDRDLAFLLCNGKIMYVFWAIVGDDFHVPAWNFESFPLEISLISTDLSTKLLKIVSGLEVAMNDAVQFKLNAGRRVGNFNLAKCRHITDRIDLIFGEALGLNSVLLEIQDYYSQMVRTDFDDDD